MFHMRNERWLKKTRPRIHTFEKDDETRKKKKKVKSGHIPNSYVNFHIHNRLRIPKSWSHIDCSSCQQQWIRNTCFRTSSIVAVKTIHATANERWHSVRDFVIKTVDTKINIKYLARMFVCGSWTPPTNPTKKGHINKWIPLIPGDTMQIEIDFIPNRRINKSFKVKVDAIFSSIKGRTNHERFLSTWKLFIFIGNI